MKKTFILAAAAIAALSACTKEIEVTPTNDTNIAGFAPVFTATIEPETKTTLAQNSETGKYTKVNWKNNDEVKLCFLSSKGTALPVTYQATPEADATIATLRIKDGETLDPQAVLLNYAIYPTSYFDANTKTLIFPATQVYEGDGEFANIPMTDFNPFWSQNGSNNQASLQFRNPAAVLAITVPHAQMSEVKSITVSSNLAMNGEIVFNSGDKYFFLNNPQVTEATKKITLDCYSKAGHNVQIPEGGSKTFYIAVLPMSAALSAANSSLQADYYSYLQIEVTDGTTTKTMDTKNGVNISLERNKIYPISFASNVNNLSNSGFANCYIVTGAGKYKIRTVKGNSTDSVGSVARAEVLWETDGTGTAPSVGGLVNSVSCTKDYITFTATDKKGNAVIAAKDASNNILWSWHIWMTDKPEDQEYFGNKFLMDRNLGATSATPGDVKALGLLYQWGRKDPFLGGAAISNGTDSGQDKAKSTLLAWPTAASNADNGTIAYAIAHPTTFITNTGTDGETNNHDWYYTGSRSTDNTRWQSSKTIYDPCPAGYRVPDNNWVQWVDYLNGTDWRNGWNETNRGIYFWSYSYIYTWYPTSGYLYFSGGRLDYTGKQGYYWSCKKSDTSDSGASIFHFYRNYKTAQQIYYAEVGIEKESVRANACAVRCLKY